VSSSTEDGLLDQLGPNHGLTPRQVEIVRFILAFRQGHDYAPTLREIGEAVGLSSTAAVSHQLSALQRKGVLYREVGCPRTVEISLPEQPAVRVEAETLVDPPGIPFQEADYVPVPVLGEIAAGHLTLAAQVYEDTIMLPKRFVPDGRLFLLRVCGDSMINAAIADGDWVVVRQQPDATDSDIVAAMIEEDEGWKATVKTLQRADGHAWLIPHNPKYTPILADRAIMLGKVVTVLRVVS
jgi:repressor LexA